MYELDGPDAKLQGEFEKKHSFKCGTFGHSGLAERHLATGDFEGHVGLWDLENMRAALWETKGHAAIINSIDGCGGQAKGYGAPELVTGGRDGRVCVWDVRQRDAPVAVFEPESKDKARDCWTVAFGNSFNDEERCVLAGYDNGDVKMFDLRTGTARWEANVGNGVCGLEFDRKDIPMNKFVVTTLESQFHTYDARTQHPKKGFAAAVEKVAQGSTVWSARHLPQNRDLFVCCGGDGSLSLYKYHYPDQRQVKDAQNVPYGVAGTVSLLASKAVSTQPICSFDWSPDKEGLAVMGSFDQAVRVAIVTKLNKA